MQIIHIISPKSYPAILYPLSRYPIFGVGCSAPLSGINNSVLKSISYATTIVAAIFLFFTSDVILTFFYVNSCRCRFDVCCFVFILFFRRQLHYFHYCYYIFFCFQVFYFVLFIIVLSLECFTMNYFFHVFFPLFMGFVLFLLIYMKPLLLCWFMCCL